MSIECRKCGVSMAKCGGYLTRVNEKGVPGIWECRPVCGADLPPDTRVMLAIDADDESPKESTP